MPVAHDHTSLQIRSLVRAAGVLELSLERVRVPEPRADEVVIRVEAAPLNPSDLGNMIGGADVASARSSGTADHPVTTLQIPAAAMKAMAARAEVPMAVGNEGAGVVVAAGSSPAAQALLRRTVAVMAGAMYSQLRCVNAADCLLLPDDAVPADGASAFVNPLTALGMVETMRREGHRGLVHTAAASNLGRMLDRLCREEGVGLVNVVRRAEQVALLKSHGAQHVCSTDAPDFEAALTEAISATGATLGFDATGGGRLAGTLLACMEAAVTRGANDIGRYGSSTHKQVYVYGGLDPAPIELVRSFGMAWGMGGWLLFSFLQRIGPEATAALKRRVLAGLKTTFHSEYSAEISLAEALQPERLAVYRRSATGAKILINPNRHA